MDHQTTAEMPGMEKAAAETLIFTMGKLGNQTSAGDGMIGFEKYSGCRLRILRVSGCEVGRPVGKKGFQGDFSPSMMIFSPGPGTARP